MFSLPSHWEECLIAPNSNEVVLGASSEELLVRTPADRENSSEVTPRLASHLKGFDNEHTHEPVRAGCSDLSAVSVESEVVECVCADPQLHLQHGLLRLGWVESKVRSVNGGS